MKLHLHVKTEYFRQIQSGEKVEEFREANAYWTKKLWDSENSRPSAYDGVIIYNAYKSGEENKIEFPWNGFSIKSIQHKHFGDKEVTVYAIKLQR